MTDFMQDPITGEMLLSNNDFQIVDGLAAIQQNVKQTLNFFFGEWFLDTTQGVPYFQQILVKDPNLNVIQALLTSQILGIPGILELLSFSFSYDAETRSITISFSARSTEGPINYTDSVTVGS